MKKHNIPVLVCVLFLCVMFFSIFMASVPFNPWAVLAMLSFLVAAGILTYYFFVSI